MLFMLQGFSGVPPSPRGLRPGLFSAAASRLHDSAAARRSEGKPAHPDRSAGAAARSTALFEFTLFFRERPPPPPPAQRTEIVVTGTTDLMSPLCSANRMCSSAM